CASAEVYLSRSDGVQSSVSGSDRRYWDDDMKKALRIGGKKEVAAVSLNKNPVSRLNEEIKVHYPNTSMQNSEEYPQERKI
ncbi:hypothetical protein pdam_00008528, partial [Pocillopora damicornis]